MEKEELKTMLEGFRDNIVKSIDERVKEQSDSANKEIAELKTKLADTEKALAAVNEQITKSKSFGLPGVEEEAKHWSWGNYFCGLFKNSQAFKREISYDAAQRFWDTVASREQRICKDYNASDGSDGGFLVPPQIYQGDIIDTVYANTAILKLPVLKLTGLKGDMPIPVDNGNLTAYHVGETEAPTKTASSFKLEYLRPKKIGVYIRVSNRLLDQTSNAIAAIVKNKMALDAAVELSRGLTNGIGANSEAAGLLSFYNGMTGKGNLSANGARFQIDNLAQMKQLLAAANELRDGNTNGAIMRPEVFYGMLRERVEMYSGQANKKGQPYAGLLNRQADIESALGLKIEATTQVPTGAVGTSSTCSKVIVGDFSKFIYASFRDPVFKVSDVASDGTTSAFLTDQSYMVMFMEYDCNCLRPTAFCGKDGAETLESNW